MPIRRPEESGPPENFYDRKEARKYTSSSRIIRIQAEIANRCIELLNIPDNNKRFILDVGCGSGLSGAALERAGHEWVGCDVSQNMLQIASEREQCVRVNSDDKESEMICESDDEGSDGVEHEQMEMPPTKKQQWTHVGSAELVQHDMGLGLPFREGSFDGVISVSALQWLCYDNSSKQTAAKRLNRFFSSLYRVLKSDSRAALQFYPENDAQANLIATAASRAGFAGGIVVDYPNSTKAKKHYLCLSMDRHHTNSKTNDTELPRAPGIVVVNERTQQSHQKRISKKFVKNKQWVVQKKEHQRSLGRNIQSDSKFTGRKRKDRF